MWRALIVAVFVVGCLEPAVPETSPPEPDEGPAASAETPEAPLAESGGAGLVFELVLSSPVLEPNGTLRATATLRNRGDAAVALPLCGRIDILLPGETSPLQVVCSRETPHLPAGGTLTEVRAIVPDAAWRAGDIVVVARSPFGDERQAFFVWAPQDLFNAQDAGYRLVAARSAAAFRAGEMWTFEVRRTALVNGTSPAEICAHPERNERVWAGESEPVPPPGGWDATVLRAREVDLQMLHEGVPVPIRDPPVSCDRAAYRVTYTAGTVALDAFAWNGTVFGDGKWGPAPAGTYVAVVTFRWLEENDGEHALAVQVPVRWDG